MHLNSCSSTGPATKTHFGDFLIIFDNVKGNRFVLCGKDDKLFLLKEADVGFLRSLNGFRRQLQTHLCVGSGILGLFAVHFMLCFFPENCTE